MIFFYKYYLYFLIYAIFGWIMEVFVSLYTKHKFINRGFLIGPYCPIYGWGCLLIIFVVGSNTSDLFGVFSKSVIIASFLEYLTSYFMEKIYNVRWWDYSSKRFNINGRICLETMIPFGLLACLIICFVHPFIISIINKLPNSLLSIISISLLIVFILDNIISTYILFKIRGTIKNEKKDNTEKIRKHIEKWFLDNTFLYRRIFTSFPTFSIFKKTK